MHFGWIMSYLPFFAGAAPILYLYYLARDTGLLAGVLAPIAGAAVGFIGVLLGFQVLELLNSISKRINTACGPGAGIAALWLGPGGGALVWFFFPPTASLGLNAGLTLLVIFLSTAFAEGTHSD